MKITKLLFLAIFVFVAQSAFAAELTLYNKSGDENLMIWVGYGNHNAQKKFMFASGIKKQHFSVPGHFRDLTWQTSSNRYHALIPSTSTMLMGTIVINPKNRYSINFDANGASEKKVRQLVGTPADN